MREQPRRRQLTPQLEALENRLTPTAPVVLSIDRAVPAVANTNAATVSYAVTFDQPVIGVDAADFRIAAGNSVAASAPVVVAGSGSAYTITINRIHGSGALRLDLIDNDSIENGDAETLGGPGAGNGSFQGRAYEILQAAPTVVSIGRSSPASATTNASSVSFLVTFSTAVTGVDPADFAVVLSGVSANPTVAIAPVSGLAYTVTASGIVGDGALGLDLIDDGSIRDAAQNRLAAANAPAAFRPQQTYSAGTNPYAVALGDVDGDGKPDIVVANKGSNSVSVMLANGDGTFRPQHTFSAGTTPYASALGDINGDGRADLIFAHSTANNVGVFLGNGDGTFQARQTFTSGTGPRSVVVGDVNGDGKPDLATANYGSSTTSVLLGNGNGTFQPMRTFATGSQPRAAALGDVNGDGKPDLAIASHDNNWVSVLLGNGDGTFRPQRTFATGLAPYSVALGDLNGDGNLDLAVANDFSTVSILLGNGSGGFLARRDFSAGPIPRSVALGDINGDGKPDVTVANSDQATGFTTSVLLNNGNGTFRPPQSFAADQRPRAVALGDLNADGKLDLAVANGMGNSLSILLGNGSGNFSGQSFTITPTAATPTSVTLTATPNATTGGELVTFTATIAPSPGDLGTVTFRDGPTGLADGTNRPVVAGVATFTTSLLAAGVHPITAAYNGAAGFADSVSNTVHFTVNSASTNAPSVVRVTPNGNLPDLLGDQRSRVVNVVVVFDRAVELDADAIALALHENNVVFGGVAQPFGFGSLPTALDLATNDNITWVVTFAGNTDPDESFPAPPDGLNSLKDGVYDLNIDAAKVHPVGSPEINAAASSTTAFHRLFGDTDELVTLPGGVENRDFVAIISIADNLVLRSSFNNPANYKPYLDFDGDQLIGIADNFQFRGRFNKPLSWSV